MPGLASSLQPCGWMQPVRIAFTRRNCNHFLQTAHFFGLHHGRCQASHSGPCQRWESFYMLEMQPKKKASPSHCCAPQGFWKESKKERSWTLQSQSILTKKKNVFSWVTPSEGKDCVTCDWYRYDRLSKGSSGLPALFTEIFHSSEEWQQCGQWWSKHPNRSHQMYLQAPGDLTQKNRNPQKTCSLLTRLNYTHHVTRKPVPLS